MRKHDEIHLTEQQSMAVELQWQTRLQDEKRRAAEARARNAALRDTYPDVVAEHPDFGFCIVKGFGKLIPTREAAEFWGVPEQRLSGLKIWNRKGYCRMHHLDERNYRLVPDRDALYDLIRDCIPEEVRGEMPDDRNFAQYTKSKHLQSVSMKWIGGGAVSHWVKLHCPLGVPQFIVTHLSPIGEGTDPVAVPVEMSELRSRGLIEEE